MRFLLLILLATIVEAQDASFYFEPRMGTPTGGDVIRFVANATNIDFRSAAPQIFFGGVAALRVTVIDSRTLTAITPPHPEGVVDVELNLAGAKYTTAPKFGYARPRDPLLIPVAVETRGAYGARWTTDIWVYNDADESVNLMPEVCNFIGAVFPCDNPLIVAAHASMRIPPFVYPIASSVERYLFPPNEVRDRLHFNVRVRDASRSGDLGTEIPIVPLSVFRNERVVLVNVPVSNRLRSVLRVYDQERIGGNSISVRIYDMESGALIVRRDTGFRPVPTDSPLRFSLGFFDLLSDPDVRGHDFVRIEIEEPDAALWAMLTLTDNVTQRVTILTSQ